MSYISFEQLDQVRQDVNALVPGYYRVAVDPFEALENQQGNCFTNAVIGALALTHFYDFDASVAWNAAAHAKPLEEGGFITVAKKGSQPRLHIQHIDLVVPRGIDRFDILTLAYGMNVIDGKGCQAFQSFDLGGKIENYNFGHVNPEDINVDGLNLDDDPLLVIAVDNEIIPTAYGSELGLESMDWQNGANEYLDALGLSSLDYDRLTEMFLAKWNAMKDWQKLELERAEDLTKNHPVY